MKWIQVLLAVLNLQSVFTAPVREDNFLSPVTEQEGSGCSNLDEDALAKHRDTALSTQTDFDKTLKNALLNNTNNLERMKAAFTMQPDMVKLCTNVKYTITCMNKTDCKVADINCTNNCSFKFVWTSFDPFSLAGKFLFHFGSQQFQIFGFKWGGECPESALKLHISIPSLTLTNDEIIDKHVLMQSLKTITTLLPKLSNSSEVSESFAIEYGHYNTGYAAATGIFSAIFGATLVLSLVPLIKKKIAIGDKKEQKPKLYFQFWALQAFLVGFDLYMIFTQASAVIITLTVVGFFCALVFTWFIDIDTPSQSCSFCKNTIHKILIFVAVLASLVSAMIFISLIPSLVLIYLLHPIQTFSQLPFLINAMLYVNSLAALLLYQLERFFSTARKLCGQKKNDNMKQESEHGLDQAMAVLLVFIQPFVTAAVLIILVLYLFIHSDLSMINEGVSTSEDNIDLINEVVQTSKDNIDLKNEVVSTSTDNINLLVTVVPSLLLLAGSIYKLDFFIADSDDNQMTSQEELIDTSSSPSHSPSSGRSRSHSSSRNCRNRSRSCSRSRSRSRSYRRSCSNSPCNSSSYCSSCNNSGNSSSNCSSSSPSHSPGPRCRPPPRSRPPPCVYCLAFENDSP